MNRDWAGAHYSTIFIEDNNDGYAGLELYCTRQVEKHRVARIIFWDACGQFVLETFGSEIPLNIVEEFIAETKTKIKTG